MNIKRELMQLHGIVHIVFRDSGMLEVYYIDANKKESIQKAVLSFINHRCLNSSFIGIDFIQVPERIIIKEELKGGLSFENGRFKNNKR